LKAELHAGRIGSVYDIGFRLRPGDGQGPNAYLDRQPYFQTMPRFWVHETAVHLVDVFRYLMGEPDWVWADLRQLNPAISGEDAGIIVLDFPGGRRAVFDGNRLADHVADNRRYVMGDAWIDGKAGTLYLNGDGEIAFRRHGANDVVLIPITMPGDRFAGGCVDAFQAHVVVHLLEGTPLESSGRDYIRNLDIVDAIYTSAASGEKVNISI
jgi:predicted dehydrogenase